MLPKRRAPLAKPRVAMGVIASGGVIFVTVEGGGMSTVGREAGKIGCRSKGEA